MEPSRTVTVYAFRMPDPTLEAAVIAGFKAPLAAIRERFRGVALEGTAETVSEDELDEQGRYRRIATGWGELG